LYTIIFGQRSHHISDEAARTIETAIEQAARLVTIPIDLAGEDNPSFDVTLNTANIVALIRHQPQARQSKVVRDIDAPRLHLAPV
jgi:hypothetical protein